MGTSMELRGLHFLLCLLVTLSCGLSAVFTLNTSTLLHSHTETQHTANMADLMSLPQSQTQPTTSQRFSHPDRHETSLAQDSTRQKRNRLDSGLADINTTTTAAATSYNLLPCAEVWGMIPINLDVGVDRHLFYRNNTQTIITRCTLILQAPAHKIVLLRIQECWFVTIRTTESVQAPKDHDQSFGCTGNMSMHRVYSVSATVNITFRFLPQAQQSPPSLSGVLSAVDSSARPSLQVVALSASAGYIQSPGWNGHSHYPPLMFSCVTLTPPSHLVLLLSFLNLHIAQGDTLDLIPGPCRTGTEFRRFRRQQNRQRFSSRLYLHQSMPRVHLFPDDFSQDQQNQNRSLSLYFSSNVMDQATGFRLKFSLYPEDRKPRRFGNWRKLPEPKWNCSTSSWPELHQHFVCDLVPQCLESEDEAPCPYTTDKCGPNRVEAGGRCFVYKEPSMRSWLAGETECRQLGGMLVSLETDRKWAEVLRILHQAYHRHSWIGLSAISQHKHTAAVQAMYRNTWLWKSGSVAYFLDLALLSKDHFCAKLVKQHSASSERFHRAIASDCQHSMPTSVLCEMPLSSKRQDDVITQSVTLPVPSTPHLSPLPLVTCPLQHLVHQFHACDSHSRCRRLVHSAEGYSEAVAVCSMSPGAPQPHFVCGGSGQHVPYSLVCDHRQDCADAADEEFCLHPPCQERELHCGRGQCVDTDKRCNGHPDCHSDVDEDNCPDHLLPFDHVKPPAVVNFDRPGGFTVTALPEGTVQCPETHFHCADERAYCLPVYVRCNGIPDCPGHEDESRCVHYRCPGFYRCRGADRTVCVHVQHLCDGWPQCPQRDDEALCGLTCPGQCTCYGLSFTCTAPFHVEAFPQVRYLEAGGSGLQQTDTAHSSMLIHLGVRACGWSNLTDFKLFNLHSLDLSDNLLRHVNFSHFTAMQQLRSLGLARNPVSGGIGEDQVKYMLPSLHVLNVSGVPLRVLNMSTVSAVFSDLQVLDVSHGGELSLHTQAVFPALRVVDLRGTAVTSFSPRFMKSMQSLQRVFADNFKLCCKTVLPNIFPGECFAPADEISSCDDLLKYNIYRFALTVFSVLSILGNFSSLVYRLFCSPGKIKTGFLLFVLHLCVSDFLMGLYLAFVGLADRMYAGVYVWSEVAWKGSALCRLAGFLSLLSSEVSAFIICLITLDRFIVLHFPFTQRRFKGTSAHIACLIVWLLGVILASVPLLPALSYWQFYSQTGICIPLPVTRADFPGHSYSFSVMIVCNFVLFLLIAVGQSLIYWSVRSSSLRMQTANNTETESVTSKEATIARRLLFIAVSDFLCWFPIGLCGLLAGFDIGISQGMSVALAIFVLPLNSALNPFIYTLNVMLHKRQKAQELRFQQFLQSCLTKQLRSRLTQN